MQKVKKSRVVKLKNWRVTLSSNCAVCVSKKSRFVVEQEASGLQDLNHVLEEFLY